MWWDNFSQIFFLVTLLLNLGLAITTSIVLIFQKQDPIKTLSWVIVMILLPYIGIVFYLFFGRNFRKEKMFTRKGAGDLRIREELSLEMLENFQNKDMIPEDLKPHKKLIIQNLKTSKSILTSNREAEIYFSGKDSLDAMFEAMEKAKKHIHLQSFILEDDEVGARLKALLIKKANEKIEVRLMVDGFGGRNLDKSYYKNSYYKELKQAGVEVLIFSPFRWLFPPIFSNYRNHRKVLVVDGEVGFLGGVNIADRYYNGGEFPEWRDTHVKLIGESVLPLQASFLLDRYFILNKNLRKRKNYYPYVEIEPGDPSSNDNISAQIISSGPDSDWSGIMQCYFTAITQAKSHIYIITPYFTPSAPLLNAIMITALSNVEVCLMIPERSDTRLTHWCTMSYISDLLSAGVKIYLFKKGFNHSKVLSIDGDYCIIGSANMDNRSFEHHFEVTSVLYDRNCAQIIEKQFHEDLSRCSLVTPVKWAKRKIKHKIYEAVARLVSPML